MCICSQAGTSSQRGKLGLQNLDANLRKVSATIKKNVDGLRGKALNMQTLIEKSLCLLALDWSSLIKSIHLILKMEETETQRF
jgi:hypothetical protein